VELIVLFVFALSIMLGIKTYVVQAFYIPSSSMENTLDIGDKVLVNKLVYHFRSIERGDVVVFNGEGSWDPPSPPSSTDPVVRLASEFGHAVVGLFGISPGVHDYIKRVIGLPGDHVVCCDAQGRVTVNGVPLNEKSYLYPGNVPSQTRFNVTVGPGRLWVMGDHRDVSYDSRGHIGDPGGGSIPESQVVGRAFTILWPTSRFRVVPIPATFNQLNAGHSALGALAAPYAPLTAAASVAVPLTWLERRLRRRLRGSRATGHGRVTGRGWAAGRMRFGAVGGWGRQAARRLRPGVAARRRWQPVSGLRRVTGQRLPWGSARRRPWGAAERLRPVWRSVRGRPMRGRLGRPPGLRGRMRRTAGRWPGFRPGRW
jgi:signal peptidase I